MTGQPGVAKKIASDGALQHVLLVPLCKMLLYDYTSGNGREGTSHALKKLPARHGDKASRTAKTGCAPDFVQPRGDFILVATTTALASCSLR
jgi:hypothetical protein